MKNIIGPAPLCTFLKYCDASSLKKNILDCGAGGKFPPLSMFYNQGYKTFGIEISEEALEKADKFCSENSMELNIKNGDMRKLDFKDESMSFIYSYNSIFHLTKADTLVAIKEITRVLKKDGLCFLNFLSVDDCGFGDGVDMGNGEFSQEEYEEEVIHSYFEDKEVDKYFEGLKVIRREKRITEQLLDDEFYTFACWDYIVKKI